MKIQRMISEYRNDFRAVLECEHCSHMQQLRNGYHDAHYHRHVIPAIACEACGLNRAGKPSTATETTHVPPGGPVG